MLFRGLKKKEEDNKPNQEAKPSQTNWENPLDLTDLERHIKGYKTDCEQANQEYLAKIERESLNLINKAKKKKM